MSDPKAPLDIKSAVEFYEEWPRLRAQAAAVSGEFRDDPQKVALLEWMIRVIDMVGPHDLKDDGS